MVRICTNCGEEYEDWNEAVTEDDCEDSVYLPPECDCYKCTEPVKNDEGRILNNMEYHTYGEACRECGGPRTEYRDLGRKGRYVCGECR